MKQHPVPQHIASYQFRLIGEMTLKQFLEIAGGILGAIIIYNLNLIPIIKWPLILFSGLFGVALAFLPYEERPLDKWIVNFFRSIYSPTQFLWKKSSSSPLSFLDYKNLSHSQKNTPLPFSKKEKELKEYLETLNQVNQENNGFYTNPIEKKEINHLQRISQILREEVQIPSSTSQSQNYSSYFKVTPYSFPTPPASSVLSFSDVQTKPQPPASPLFSSKPKSKPIIETAPPLTPPILVESTISQKLNPTVAAQFSTTLPIPATPNIPNFIVGMVIDENEKIVPQALIEVLNQQGETVRALKSNNLGQFFCATPLENGQYQIKVEHPYLEFDVVEFKAEGKIIPPIKIKAKGRKII